MRKDRVTLEPVADDYGRRCRSIGLERRNLRDLQDAINHPTFKVRHHQLLDVLAEEYRASKPIIERPPWKTIQTGTHKSNRELRQALLDNGNKIGTWGDDILARIAVASKPTEIELVRVTVAELGFPEGATREQIYKKALSMGLALCPAEVGPQLRRQYPDQPNAEWLLIAMEPIADSDGRLRVFSVACRDSARWLHAYYGYPDSFWHAGNQWVFCRK